MTINDDEQCGKFTKVHKFRENCEKLAHAQDSVCQALLSTYVQLIGGKGLGTRLVVGLPHRNILTMKISQIMVA